MTYFFRKLNEPLKSNSVEILRRPKVRPPARLPLCLSVCLSVPTRIHSPIEATTDRMQVSEVRQNERGSPVIDFRAVCLSTFQVRMQSAKTPFVSMAAPFARSVGTRQVISQADRHLFIHFFPPSPLLVNPRDEGERERGREVS